MNRQPTTHIEETTSGAIVPKLKFLNVVIEDKQPSGVDFYMHCACGGGGGCSGGFDKTMRTVRI